MRRAPAIDTEPIIASMADPGATDEVAGRVLDAAIELLASGGVRRCSVEDIAERAGLGRTSIYRRFEGRDQIIHAALARECCRFFETINQAVGHLDRLEDRVVEGFLVGLGAVQASVLPSLMRTDPATILPLMTTDAGPVLHTAREFLVEQYRRAAPDRDPEGSAEVAELLVRLAFSFVLTPQSVLPLAEPAAARVALHRCLDPLLGVGGFRPDPPRPAPSRPQPGR